MPRCADCGLTLAPLLEQYRLANGAIEWRCCDRESCHKRRVGDDSGLVRATWNRSVPGFQILAFADHSYLIDIGSDAKPPLITIGWYRWKPDSLAFPRWRKLPPPDEP